MFGSSANGFGSKRSDLDICLTMPPDNQNVLIIILYITSIHSIATVVLMLFSLWKDEKNGIIEKIAKVLKKKPSNVNLFIYLSLYATLINAFVKGKYRQVISITTARVPIVKLFILQW